MTPRTRPTATTWQLLSLRSATSTLPSLRAKRCGAYLPRWAHVSCGPPLCLDFSRPRHTLSIFVVVVTLRRNRVIYQKLPENKKHVSITTYNAFFLVDYPICVAPYYSLFMTVYQMRRCVALNNRCDVSKSWAALRARGHDGDRCGERLMPGRDLLPYQMSCPSQALELDNKYVKAWAKKGDIEFFMKEYHKALDSYKMVSVAYVLRTVPP